MKTMPEPDRLLSHDADGIQEYDNPMPRWWVWIFWATILFSIVYALNLPGLGPGPGRIADYQRQMADAEQRFGSRGAASAADTLDDEAWEKLEDDPAQRELGRTTFANTCVPCHREDGGGSIGPNLTDSYWIHGSRPEAIRKTVREGVLDKGMPSWDATLSPEQVTAVVIHVRRLRGTHPPEPKAPQGVLQSEDDAGEEER